MNVKNQVSDLTIEKYYRAIDCCHVIILILIEPLFTDSNLDLIAVLIVISVTTEYVNYEYMNGFIINTKFCIFSISCVVTGPVIFNHRYMISYRLRDQPPRNDSFVSYLSEIICEIK